MAARSRTRSKGSRNNGQGQDPILKWEDGDTYVVEMIFDSPREFTREYRGEERAGWSYKVLLDDVEHVFFAGKLQHDAIEDLDYAEGDVLSITRQGEGLDTEWIVDYARDASGSSYSSKSKKKKASTKRSSSSGGRKGSSQSSRKGRQSQPKDRSGDMQLPLGMYAQGYIQLLGHVEKLLKASGRKQLTLEQLNAVTATIVIQAERSNGAIQQAHEWLLEQGGALPGQGHVEYVMEQLKAAKIKRRDWLMLLRRMFGQPGLKKVEDITEAQAVEFREYIQQGADLKTFIEVDDHDEEEEEEEEDGEEEGEEEEGEEEGEDFSKMPWHSDTRSGQKAPF